MMATRRLIPSLARSEHFDRLIVHLVQYSAFEHIADDRSASMTMMGEGTIPRERNSERDDGFAGRVG